MGQTALSLCGLEKNEIAISCHEDINDVAFDGFEREIIWILISMKDN